MRVGVLGTGKAGQAIATRLVELGHEVRMGSRSAGNERAVGWAEEVGERGTEGSFADAAEFSELIFNCTAGEASLDALAAAGEGNLAGKTLVDVANALDHSGDGPPRVAVVDGDSLAERIQAAFPDARVVKALNTVNAAVMVDPAQIPGEHVIFVCGDDAEAKDEVVALVGEFGWPPERVVDLGGVEAARGPELYLPLWIRLMGTLGTTGFNITIAR